MRCLAQGQLPLWLPDLNAGFGSPGIRLYSPGGPSLVGILGLALGDVGKALRLVWFAALVALVLVFHHWHPKASTLDWLLLWASPLVPFLLLYRGASSELLALPLALWLLEAAIHKAGSPQIEAFLWAGLWLLHTPSFVMAATLVVTATLIPRPSSTEFGRRIAPLVAGFALSAWHWLPLLGEKHLVRLEEGLTAGIFAATNNFLFALNPHDAPAVRRLEALAALWTVIAAMAWFQEKKRSLLLLTAVLLATPLTYPLWLALPPLRFLQFPWRFLTPVSLLLPGAIASLSRRMRMVAIVLFLLPHLWMPQPRVVRDPEITGKEGWGQLGAKIFASFSGNPLVVDAVQNRPAAFAALARQLQRFGPETLVLGPGPVAIEEWRPLRRTVVVEAPSPGLLEFRLLAYPFWRAWVDGRPVVPQYKEGIVAVPVPPGRHQVVVRWSGNPVTPWGWVLALVALGVILAFPRSGKL